MKKPEAIFGNITTAQEGKPEKYHYRKDGTVVLYTVCCDCSLVHLEEFKPLQSHMRVRVWRDDARTEELRKKAKIRVTRKKC